MKANDVIRIGLRRSPAASTVALKRGLPCGQGRRSGTDENINKTDSGGTAILVVLVFRLLTIHIPIRRLCTVATGFAPGEERDMKLAEKTRGLDELDELILATAYRLIDQSASKRVTGSNI
jgi:hypothetical protein